MMMKRMTVPVLVLVCLSITTIALAWGGKDGDSNATGRITKLTVKNPMALVEGTTSKGKLWLAYTVRWEDGREIDCKP